MASGGIIQNEGLLTIGDSSKDLNSYIPEIKGEAYGINSTTGGSFNFYNGALIGKQGGYTSTLTPVLRQDTETTDENSYGDYKRITLKLRYNYIIEKNNNTNYYTKLSDAINAASSEDTIKVCQDVKLDSTTTVNKKVTLDLQRFDMTLGKNNITVAAGANLTITGESWSYISTDYLEENQEGCAINNNGTLIIEKCQIRVTSGKNANGYGIKNKGTLNIKEGDITVYGDKSAIGIENTSGIVSIEAGSVYADANAQGNSHTATAYGIYSGSGTVTIGSASSELSSTEPEIKANYTVDSGYTGTAYGVYSNGSTFIFNNGTIKGKTVRYNVEPTIRENTELKIETEEGYQKAYLQLTKVDINECDITITQTGERVYYGSEHKLNVELEKNGNKLTEGTDYEIEYSNNVNAGEATAKIKGINKYFGEKTYNFTINAKHLNTVSMTLSPTSYEYDGTAKTPTVTVKDGNTTLTKDTDYTVGYSNNTNAGTATVTITGKGNYTGTKEVTFSIEKKELNSDTITLATTSYTYDGTAKTPTVTVKDGSATLTKDTDYTVGYSNNTNVGTATVTITGKGNYTGTVNKNFSITGSNEPTPPVTKKSISDCTITLAPTSYEYDGTAKTPTVTVKDGSTTLTKDTDYTVGYSNNTNVGTATVTITGKGNYTGTATENFTITKKQDAPEQPTTKKELNQCKITLEVSSYIYDGKAKTPKVTVKDGDTTLTEGTDYAVTYSNNTNVGTATVTVTGKGNYTGTATEEFKITASTENNQNGNSGNIGNNSSTNASGSNTISNQSTSGKTDTTLASKILPATGLGKIITVLIITILIIGIAGYIRYRKINDIK